LFNALFIELQHRVANNLLGVAFALRNGPTDLQDSRAQDLLERIESRVTAHAALHRRLYDPDTYQRGLEPQLAALLPETFRDLAVEVRLAIAPVDLSLDRMTAIVLLVNEAAANAAKHVFRGWRGGRFEGVLKRAGRAGVGDQR
jgi:two-component system, sensor histidine kinase PdtaS